MDNRDRDVGEKDGEKHRDLEEPLGISREPVKKDEKIRASMDEDSVRRRRRRALGPDEDKRTIVGESDDPEGATGMDMGGGGDGHGIKRSR